MTVFPLLFWLSLLLPGAAIARRFFARELEGGPLPSLAVAWMCALGALAPAVVLGYLVRMPAGVLAGLVALFVAWGAVDLTRVRAWRPLRGRLLRDLGPALGVAGVVVVASVVLADQHGAILDNDSRVHVARVRHLFEYGLSNADPFVRTPVEYPYPIYHTNLLHALSAAGSVLTGVDPVTMWFNSLSAAHLLIAAGMAYLAWAVLGGAWAPWIAALAVMVNRGPYPFTIYPNQLAPWALIPIALGVLLRVQSGAAGLSPLRAATATGLCAAVVGMFHPLYAGFLFVVGAPAACVGVAWAMLRRRGSAPDAWRGAVRSGLAAAAALVVVSLAFPLASVAMTPREIDRAVPKEQVRGDGGEAAGSRVDDGAERGAGARGRTADQEAQALGKPAEIEAARTRRPAPLVRRQDGFDFYERGAHDWIARTLGRGFTGGWNGIPWWRVWMLALGMAASALVLRRREPWLLLVALGTVLVVMSVPPLCTLALKALGAQWILGRFEMVAFVLWIPLAMPAIAAAVERARAWSPVGAWIMQSVLALASLPVASLHASQGPPYTWSAFIAHARSSEGVRNGRQHAGLLRQKQWMDEAIPRGAVVLAGPLTGTWVAMLHGASLVASERSSTGISSGRVRRQHIDEMFSPETDEGRRADLFHAYGVTHVLTRGRAPTWSRYWTVGGNRRHGHVVLTLRSVPDPALLWMREIEVARAQLDRGDAAGAIGRLRPVVRDHPRAVDAWFTLANALMASGGIEAAAAAYAQAEALEPDDPVHALMLGNAYSRLGRLGEAALEFERCAAIALRQNDAIAGAAANFNLGNTLYRMDRDEAALAAYERALELDADHVKARTARGWLRQDLGLDPPAPESPAAEGPAVDEHEAEDPGMDDPRVDDPRVDDPRVDDPRVDDPRVDDPQVDDPSVDAPRADTPPTAPATRPVP